MKVIISFLFSSLSRHIQIPLSIHHKVFLSQQGSLQYFLSLHWGLLLVGQSYNFTYEEPRMHPGQMSGQLPPLDVEEYWLHYESLLNDWAPQAIAKIDSECQDALQRKQNSANLYPHSFRLLACGHRWGWECRKTDESTNWLSCLKFFTTDGCSISMTADTASNPVSVFPHLWRRLRYLNISTWGTNSFLTHKPILLCPFQVDNPSLRLGHANSHHATSHSVRQEVTAWWSQ